MIKTAIHGLGNIGKHVVESLETATDMNCLGVIRRPASLGSQTKDLRGLQDFSDYKSLVAANGKPDVMIICGPSRQVPADAAKYLAEGVHTVDSFDIHSEILTLVKQLDPLAKDKNCVAISSAGWDPGTDSIFRTVFEVMAPTGVTFTNFGRGRSMGHSVAARAIKGVLDAIAITIPDGGGRHSRLVYVAPEKGATEESIRSAIKSDPYFCYDPLELRFVPDKAALAFVADNSHGVLLERVGASGHSSNQRFSFDMRIDNPALTAQVLVSAARAATRLSPGSYTLIDIPPVAFLPGERLANIARLV